MALKNAPKPKATFVIGVQYTPDHFERMGHTLLDFTKTMVGKNDNKNIPVTRQEVNSHWDMEVHNNLPRDHPMRARLHEQKTSPMVEEFWERRADEGAFMAKHDKQSQTGFHIIKRARTSTERNEHKYAVIMTHEEHVYVIFPDIKALPLRKLLPRPSAQDLGRKSNQGSDDKERHMGCSPE